MTFWKGPGHHYEEILYSCALCYTALRVRALSVKAKVEEDCSCQETKHMKECGPHSSHLEEKPGINPELVSVPYPSHLTFLGNQFSHQ